MKELSIEEKAKRYDEALERARKLKENPKAIFFEEKNINVYDYIFPELKESEDEKVRKALIRFHKSTVDVDGIKGEDIIAWLEKQAERKTPQWMIDFLDNYRRKIGCSLDYDEARDVDGKILCIKEWLEKQSEQNKWKPSKDEMDVLYGLAYITNQYDEHKEEVITRLYQDLKREFFNGSSYENIFPNTEDDVRRRSIIQVLEYAKSLDAYNQYGKADIDKNIAWLEKQGETFTKKDVDDAYLKGICDAKNELEKQGEQHKQDNSDVKDCNSIDPHFGKPIDEVEPKFHEGEWIVDDCGYVWKIKGILNKFYKLEGVEGDESLPTIEWIDETSHLWTINDAKDGDILITKGKPQPFIFKKYDEDTDYVYAYCGICDLVKDDSFYANGSDEDDQLWTCYSVNGDIYPATKEQREQLEKTMADAGYEWSEEKKELRKIEDDSKNCKQQIMSEITSLVTDYIKQKPTWSEEDEHRVKDTIYFLDTARKHYASTVELDACINWLKALKQRIGG